MEKEKNKDINTSKIFNEKDKNFTKILASAFGDRNETLQAIDRISNQI